MTNNIKSKTAAVATAVGLSLGGAAYATAASTSTPPGHPHETELTGDVAAKVKAAALAKVPGATVLRVETDAGGVYEAHVRKSDGTEAEVHVDKDYNVTSVDTRPAGGSGHHGGHGGHGRIDTAALAKAIGVDEAKVTAALAKVAPSAKDHDKGDMAAAIAKALGQSEADVQAVLDANRPDRSSGGPGRGDRGAALAKALAARFGVSESAARSALDAAHGDRGDRGDALATALAKELGVDAAKVKTALDAQHPDHP